MPRFGDGIAASFEIWNERYAFEFSCLPISTTRRTRSRDQLGLPCRGFRARTPTTLREGLHDRRWVPAGDRDASRFCNHRFVRVIIATGTRGEVRFLFCTATATTRLCPPICGTGLEDYGRERLGSVALSHHAPYGGAPVDVRRAGQPNPDVVGFYRWHSPTTSCSSRPARHDSNRSRPSSRRRPKGALEATRGPTPVPGRLGRDEPRMLAWASRSDRTNYCETSYGYCRDPSGSSLEIPTAWPTSGAGRTRCGTRRLRTRGRDDNGQRGDGPTSTCTDGTTMSRFTMRENGFLRRAPHGPTRRLAQFTEIFEEGR